MPFMESGAMNVTQSGMVMNSMGLAPLIFIVLCIAAVIGLAIIITSMERFAWFMNLVERATQSVRYTVYGIGMSAVGLVAYLIFEMLSTATRGFDPIWYLYGIAAYAGFTILGWVGAKVAGRIRRMHTAYTESKKKSVEITEPS